MNNQIGKGRGRILELLTRGNTTSFASNASSIASESESGYVPSTPSRGSGRGKIFELLSRKPKTQIESPCSSGSASIPSTGRGKLLERIKNSESNLSYQTKNLSVSDESGIIDEAVSSADTAETSVDSFTETEVVKKHGEFGVSRETLCNYIRLKIAPDSGYYEYEVRFNPNIESIPFRKKLLHQQKSIIGNVKTFDGATLYLPHKLPDRITMCFGTHEVESSNKQIELSIIFKRTKRMGESRQFYNVLFNQIMRILQHVQIDRRMFDPSEPKLIPQHHLEVWPGYITCVDEYEDGLMLQLDVNHRVLSSQTVLDLFKRIHATCQRTNGNMKEMAQTALLGQIVLTRYNNKFYRVDDIDFDASPKSTFKSSDGGETSYVDYYRSQYDLEIRDKNQPLLVSRRERRVNGKKEMETLTFNLVPELCCLTGLTDEMRADHKVMKDIAAHTRVTPNQRIAAMRKFYQNVKENERATAVLSGWGLALDERPINLNARNLGEENIIFGNGQTKSAGPMANFDKYVGNTPAFDIVHITDWLLIYPRSERRYADVFVTCLERIAHPMGTTIVKPMICTLDDDKSETYARKLREKLTAKTQIVVLICPTSRDDRYAVIKKVCCSEIPIPSQVINSRTLSNETKNRAIVQKIALQMNCKLGGALWSIKIPFKNVMICGIDTYHDSNKGNSVAAFVASLNSTYTRYYSKAIIQSQKEELQNGLSISLQNALYAYKNYNTELPERIVIFRDGVGDGQLNACKEYEIPQLKSACKRVDPDYNPSITFLTVQKRINTRLFERAQGNNYNNPAPGTVVDHTITRRYLYDFFLVSQRVTQGTVTPTHIIVLHDEADFKPDILQRLTYKLCFLYYNWPGSVRVPAVCQYAHKLAFLVGQSVKRETHSKLADKLFYL